MSTSSEIIMVHIVEELHEAEAVAAFTLKEIWGIPNPADLHIAWALDLSKKMNDTRVAAFDLNGMVVATAGLAYFSEGNTWGLLTNVATAPSKRLRGFGRQVVSCVEDIARDKGVQALDVHASRTSGNFYERLGYQWNSRLHTHRKML